MEEDISKKFLNLIQTSTPKKKTKLKKFEILKKLEQEITEARKMGYGFSEIAKYLTQSGVKTAPHQVQLYCREVLKEKPLYKKVKKDAKPKKEAKSFTPHHQTTQSQTTTHPRKPIPAGFRMPTDDL